MQQAVVIQKCNSPAAQRSHCYSNGLLCHSIVITTITVSDGLLSRANIQILYFMIGAKAEKAMESGIPEAIAMASSQ